MTSKLTFAIVSIFPEMFNALNFGIVGRAKRSQLIQLDFYNPRDYTHDPHRQVDDRPYGGGPGMVMLAEPLIDAIKAAKQKLGPTSRSIYLSPQGPALTDNKLNDLLSQQNLILLCGRYEGIDERVITSQIDEECSIGDFVVSGGELPAMLLIDALTRKLPTALGHSQSAEQDSFAEGLLDHPQFTRPEKLAHASVPKTLLSGDHQAIRRWRLKQSLGKTWQKRPDLLKRRTLDENEQKLLAEFIAEHKRSD